MTKKNTKKATKTSATTKPCATKSEGPSVTAATAADLRIVLDLAGKVAASYIQRPYEERTKAETYASLVVGLVGALLRSGEEATLAELVVRLDVDTLIGGARAPVIDMLEWLTEKNRAAEIT